MAKLKVGVIGIGSIANDHLTGLAKVENAEIFALSSRNRSRVMAAAEKFGAKVWYQDYKQLIANDDVRAVWVCTPNRLHYPMAMEVLAAGKHLFLEKPMGETLGQCREIHETAKANGLQASLCYLSRYMPVYREVRRVINEGAIGTPRYFVGRRMWYRDSFPSWWADEKRLGIPHFGSHSIDLGVWFLGGRGMHVFAQADSRKKEFPGESDYALTCRMTSGGVINLVFSMSSRYVQSDHVIVVDEGALTINGADTILLNGEPFRRIAGEDAYALGFYNEAREFVEAVLEGRPSLTNSQEALKSVEIVEAAGQSADTNRSVTIE